MPIDLPGFYFDYQRNRYFPLAYKPKDEPQVTQYEKKHYHSTQKLLNRREINGQRTLFNNSIIEAHCSHPNSKLHINFNYCHSAIETTDVKGETYLIVGGSSGRIGKVSAGLKSKWSSAENINMVNIATFASEVTSLKASPSNPNLALVSTLGQATGGNLHVSEIPSMQTRATIPMKKTSVWTADYLPCGTKAAVGVSKAVGVVDLVTSRRWFWKFGSDPLTLKPDETGNIIFSGYRDNSIRLVDIRAPERQQHEILMRMPSSVCSLLLLSNGCNFVSSAMDGSVWLWDARFSGEKRDPLRSFPGHVNSASILQLGIDPSETLIASGGEDRVVRLWSLSSGKLLHTETGFSSTPTALHWERNCGFSDNAWNLWIGSLDMLHCLDGSLRCNSLPLA